MVARDVPGEGTAQFTDLREGREQVALILRGVIKANIAPPVFAKAIQVKGKSFRDFAGRGPTARDCSVRCGDAGGDLTTQVRVRQGEQKSSREDFLAYVDGPLDGSTIAD